MSSPLPVPSKAAIRALRSLILGTTCAIGAIVEDRRRRISTLKTAVANKHAIQSSEKFQHGSFEELYAHLDTLPDLGTKLQWYEKKDGHGLRRHYHTGKDQRATVRGAAAVDSEAKRDSRVGTTDADGQGPTRRPPPTRVQPVSARTNNQAQASANTVPPNGVPALRAFEIRRPTVPNAHQQRYPALIDLIKNCLASQDEGKLSEAVRVFVAERPPIRSNPLFGQWLDLSHRICRQCQERGEWEDASQVMALVASRGPLSMAEYLAYDPSPIIQFHLHRKTPDTPPPKSNIALAAKLFLARLDAKPQTQVDSLVKVGEALLFECLESRAHYIAKSVFLRTICWSLNPVEFVGWAIREHFRHSDHKTVINIFLVEYSYLQPAMRNFNKTIDCVTESALALKGDNADEILEAFAHMVCPGNGKLRSRWVMDILRAHWDRHQDLLQTVTLFEKLVSLQLLAKLSHPEGVYRTMIEIAAKEGNEEVAQTYTNELVAGYEGMKSDVALKLALLRAREGDWDSVLYAFKQVRPSELPSSDIRTAVTHVLKLYTESHSAVETQDFTTRFIRATHTSLHPHLVSLIAHKFSEDGDTKGFVNWVKVCGQEEGFAPDASLCNTVLHHCSTMCALSFPELSSIHAKFKMLNPHCSDEVTTRIMNQARNRGSKKYAPRHRTRTLIANRMAYRGRSTESREVYEAMNLQVTNNRPSSAVMIYNRATHFGMPFSSHCFRILILATLQAKGYGSDSALTLLKNTHTAGHNVDAAVSTFVKHQIDMFTGGAEDMMTYMRNILHRLEAANTPIGAAVLMHLANASVRVGQHEKAIVLCEMARDRSEAADPSFTRQSFRILSSAYSQLLDVNRMHTLLEKLAQSKYAPDKLMLSHLKSIRRLVTRMLPSHGRTAMLDILNHGVAQLRTTRTEARTQGKMISLEILQIMDDAVGGLDPDATESVEESSRWQDEFAVRMVASG
ncbi:hypothetical protein F4808DRAFT_445657 [Astrocystis sublimbata]|nr:hypothetical protein F4808DRAFT_445657 [Astrocystis sublimbata]